MPPHLSPQCGCFLRDSSGDPLEHAARGLWRWAGHPRTSWGMLHCAPLCPSHRKGRILYSCRMSCTSFSEHWVSVTVELKEMPPPFLG